MKLQAAIDDAKRALATIKRVAPWLLVEYGELKQAEVEYREARRRYEALRKKWKEIGE